MSGRICFNPGIAALRRAFGRPSADLETVAAECITIAPSIRTYIPPARFLPGQLDRLRGVAFAPQGEVVDSLRGDFECDQPATLALCFRHVDLFDGVLYCGGATRHLRIREHRAPAYRRPTELVQGALYESWGGNRWFGCWLADDCLTYTLAERFGTPVTTSQATGHATDYAARLGLAPRHVRDVHFDELILFSDLAQNPHKARRAITAREKLVADRQHHRHPGVFLLRGKGGEQRKLLNERAIAERLARDRGLRVVDPSASTLDEIIDACAGADVVAGLEGSQLVHGLITMPDDAVMLAIQPPDRVVSFLKMSTDRQGQAYAFVIGEGDSDGFTANVDEIERTLDLAMR